MGREGLPAPELRQWRRRRALSQADLARLSGVALVTVARLETGHTGRPSTLRRLAEALGVTVDQLMGDDTGQQAAAA